MSNVCSSERETQCSAHLLTSRPGHLLTSELHHQSVGMAGINTGSDSQEDTSSGIVALITSLSLQQQQQHPHRRPKSPPLSSFEREAIRTRCRPWSGCPALCLPSADWHRVWCTFHRKSKVVCRLKF